MELFDISNLPATAFPVTYIPHQDSAGTASVGRQAQVHNDFVRLLQHAALCQIPILPLTWQPAFEKLGFDGATGTVHQNFLNSTWSLAFKRFRAKPTNDCSIELLRVQQYEAMITEMTILSRLAIQQHPNIVELVGLCFELSPIANEVWPVLIFTKSNRGDLAIFREHRTNLDEDIILEICGEVASGLLVLHNNDIVHGDIKPSNVLVAEYEDTQKVAVTIADFGFSRYASTRDAYIQLPRSEPWDAPEWSYAYISPSAAQKMDIYSFGLLCFWLLFGNATLVDWDLPSTTLHAMFLREDITAFEEFQWRKRTGNDILHLAQKLTDYHQSYSPQTRYKLRKLFALTLANRAEERASSIGELVKVLRGEDLSSKEESAPQQNITWPHNWHGTLKMEQLFFTLESCDYRVHAFITKNLANVAEGNGCDICVQNAAFQLVFCRAIGFGLDHGSDKDIEHVEHSGKTMTDLQDAIQNVKLENKKSDAIMAKLARLGYRHDFPSLYMRDGVLSDAINYYRRAVEKRKALFQSGHFSSLRLKGLLLSLLRQDDQLHEAVQLALETEKEIDNGTVVDKLEVKEALARLLLELEEFSQAEQLAREVAATHAGITESERSTERLDNQILLVRIFEQQQKYDEAIRLANDTLTECLSELDELHTSTIGVQRCLARGYSATGQLELALETYKSLVSKEERLMTHDYIDPKLVEDVSIFGVHLYRASDVESAKQCYDKVRGYIARDQSMAKHAVNVLNNTALALMRQDDHNVARVMLEALLLETTEILGDHGPEAAMVMGNLAFLYYQQGDYDRAAELQRQVVAARQEVLGLWHAHTITALSHLRLTLLAQSKHEAAASIGEQELNACALRPNASLGDIVEAAETIAVSLESTGAFPEALVFFESEVHLPDTSASAMSFMPLSSTARAALCYLCVGNADKAMEITDLVQGRVLEVSPLTLDGLVPQLKRLSGKFLEKDCSIKSEQILATIKLVETVLAGKDIERTGRQM